VITNDVSDYINLLVRTAHIICNHTLLLLDCENAVPMVLTTDCYHHVFVRDCYALEDECS